MTKPDLIRIRARMEAASPTPWTWQETESGHALIRDAKNTPIAFCYHDESRSHVMNAQWICSLHDCMKALLARIDELEAELQHMEDSMGEDW